MSVTGGGGMNILDCCLSEVEAVLCIVWRGLPLTQRGLVISLYQSGTESWGTVLGVYYLWSVVCLHPVLSLPSWLSA